MASSWSVDEVQTFLSLIAEDRIQRELDGATRNEKVFQEVAQLLAAHGYHRTYKQCRDKLKKLKSDYRTIKDHNDRSGANRRTWKWFDQMDAIYGSRPASNGREGALDSATSMLENTMEDDALSFDSFALSPCREASTAQLDITASTPVRPPTPATPSTSRTPERVVPGKRKRGMHHQEHLAVLREMQVSDVQQQELNRELKRELSERSERRSERHLQMAIDEARQAREQEAALRMEENAQAAAFNQAFLNIMGMLVQAMSGRQQQNSQPD